MPTRRNHSKSHIIVFIWKIFPPNLPPKSLYFSKCGQICTLCHACFLSLSVWSVLFLFYNCIFFGGGGEWGVFHSSILYTLFVCKCDVLWFLMGTKNSYRIDVVFRLSYHCWEAKRSINMETNKSRFFFFFMFSCCSCWETYFNKMTYSLSYFVRGFWRSGFLNKQTSISSIKHWLSLEIDISDKLGRLKVFISSWFRAVTSLWCWLFVHVVRLFISCVHLAHAFDTVHVS